MQLAVILRILGILLSLFSFTMIPPLIISLVTNDGSIAPFLLAFIIILLTGLAFWLPVKNFKNDLRLRDGFVVVVIFWVGLGIGFDRVGVFLRFGFGGIALSGGPCGVVVALAN